MDAPKHIQPKFEISMSPAASLGWKLYQLSRDCKTISQLKQILARIIQSDASTHPSSLSALVSFSAISPAGDLRLASLVFAQIEKPTSFAYNSMIHGLVNARLPDRAFTLYLRMTSPSSCEVENGSPPDKFTFPFVLKACVLLSAVGTGKAVHGRIMQMGFSSDLYIQSGLVRMYSDFREIDAARSLFDEIPERDCVLWNSMIGGYVKCGLLEPARVLFEEMPRKNAGAYNAMMGGFVKFGCLDNACKLFDEMPDRDVVSWNTMIGAQARLGSVGTAWELFNLAPERNGTTWSAIISGFAQSGQFEDAFKAFKGMLFEGLRPNQAVLVSVLSSCAHLGALEQGIWIHGYIHRLGMQVDDLLGASLVDMYFKCGFIQGANLVFDKLDKRDVCAWTSMIYGLAIHGHSHKALAIFSEMERLEFRPNHITFVAILCACSHAGLVDEGCKIFDRIHRVYGMNPTIEHYTCMVDLLSRANLLEEAQELVGSMPMEPDVFVWGALLSGFKIHGRRSLLDQDLGQELSRLEPSDGGAYVLVSNLYASFDRWDDAARMRRMMVGLGVKKNPGCSLIEVDQVVHEFLAGGTMHPRSKGVYEMLAQLYRETKIDGF